MFAGGPSDPAPQVPAHAQFAALSDVMAMAEFAPDGTLQRANGKYLAMLGVTPDAALGRAHRSFCTPEFAGSPDYDAFWRALTCGGSHAGLAERLRSDGSRCWLEAIYAPVRDVQGRLLQILKVATDVTDRREQERGQEEHLRRLSLVADASDTAVIISDSVSGIIYTNAGFTRMFGWAPHEAAGRDPIALLAADSPGDLEQEYRRLLAAGHPVEREEVVVGKDNQRYWAKVTSNPVADVQGRWQYTVSMLTDITSAKLHEALQHRALESLAREAPLIDTLETMCREAERIAPELTAAILEVSAQGHMHVLAAPSLPGAFRERLDSLSAGPIAGSVGTAAWRNASVCVDDIATDPLWAPHRDMVRPWGYVGCWATPIRDSAGAVIGIFALYFRQRRQTSAERVHQRIIDACTHLCALAIERDHARQRIRQLAFYDGLTGMPNRSLLESKADHAIAGAARRQQSLAVVSIDLDRFKQVNDSFGKAAGDDVLRTIADRLQSELRNAGMAGRLSADEFVVVLSPCTAERASQVVRRLQAALMVPVPLADTSVSLSASAGIAMFPTHGRDIESLLDRADMAMHQAKSAGRGGLCFFSTEMNQLAQERLTLETALRTTLREGGLHLNYQPQIDLVSGRLYGVEALARWSHPVLGDISPVRFVPLAEECGLVDELGEWVMREACRQLADWRGTGLVIPAVSVNLSATCFDNPVLPRVIDKTLRQHGLRPSDLTVELTESVLLDSHADTLNTIADVHALGVRLSMDDFGTGYSSLSYLRRLPVSELKLDRSFVADLEHSEAARALSGAILGIGRSLQLTVVAEGVETVAQDSMLRSQGYPVAQGYLFSRPLAPQALASWLRQPLHRGAGPADAVH